MSDAVHARETTVFRVMLGETGWTVREDGGGSTSHATRRDAVAEARRRAQSAAVARVILHYADNTVERQLLFHGEPRPMRTWRAGDVQASGSKSTT